ncbi:unnamed protein product [Leptidea sinapis]|uniref:WKF domain-containing protein n=1 Tax=Leptidea sinapis TaxID=189913 RepID=A0A5E4QGM2_9NEOP|nr:unnamed protein product [Leptidea sinapis]
MGKRKNKKSFESESNEIDTDNVIDENINMGEKHIDENISDSESESEPKKPKKKKKNKEPIPSEESSSKKGKKSIRQMKKERYAERQAEAAALSKDQFKTQCLNYLSQWKHDRQNWKFMKVKQGWLYRNKFSKELVPESLWPVLVEYFDSAQGNIRKMLLDDANKIIKQMDDWMESQDKNNDLHNEDETETNDSSKPDDIVYNRARNLIQCLQE